MTSKRVAISGEQVMKYLFAKVVDDFEKWAGANGIERPRLENGHVGFYFEDIEEYWRDK